MEILSKEELASRIDFRRPLHPEPEEPDNMWCIPFEWGSNVKGTYISIAKAKEIAAELRASVAEAEMRALRRYFDREKERGDSLCRQLSQAQLEALSAKAEIRDLKGRLRARTRTKKG